MLASRASVGGVWASEASGGGVPASEASFPPEASQVVAEGDGLRVFKYFSDCLEFRKKSGRHRDGNFV